MKEFYLIVSGRYTVRNMVNEAKQAAPTGDFWRVIFIVLGIFISGCQRAVYAPERTDLPQVSTRAATNTSLAASSTTPSVNPTLTTDPDPARNATFPSGIASQFRYRESQCTGTTRDIETCTIGKAYEAARALDLFLVELDRLYPGGAWERALEDVIYDQESWERDKLSFCRINTELSLGGSGHGIYFMSCILEQNLARQARLHSLACLYLDGVDGCLPKKQGGEAPLLTAVPAQTPDS